MRDWSPARIGVAALGLAALFCVAVLALIDWSFALMLAAAVVAGGALMPLLELAGRLYARQRVAVLATLGVAVVALLVLLRPGGESGDDVGQPLEIAGYGAELWPQRGATTPSFILREALVPDSATAAPDASASAASGRAILQAVRTGPVMLEVRFAPGASTARGALRLAADGRANVVVNPWEDGEFLQSRDGSATRVPLPGGDVVRIAFARLPDEIRIGYLVGAGTALRPLAAIVAPLRAMPPLLAVLLFAALGIAIAVTWRDLVAPLRRLLERPPPGATKSPPGASPIERAPLVPRRK